MYHLFFIENRYVPIITNLKFKRKINIFSNPTTIFEGSSYYNSRNNCTSYLINCKQLFVLIFIICCFETGIRFIVKPLSKIYLLIPILKHYWFWCWDFNIIITYTRKTVWTIIKNNNYNTFVISICLLP